MCVEIKSIFKIRFSVSRTRRRQTATEELDSAYPKLIPLLLPTSSHLRNFEKISAKTSL